MHKSHNWAKGDFEGEYFCWDCTTCTCHPDKGNHPDNECTKDGGL